MTKYILIGGYPAKAEDGGKALVTEMVSGFTRPVKILDCLFARPKENWQTAYEQDRQFFQTQAGVGAVDVTLASLENFSTEVSAADVVYFRGGSTQDLLKHLALQSEWVRCLEGKTVAGSSAGAALLAAYHYNLDTGELGEGLGLLPVKVLTHYLSDYNAPNIDWDSALRALQNYKESLEVVTLREGEFVVVN